MYRVAICDNQVVSLEYVSSLVLCYFINNCKISKHTNSYSLETYIYETVKGEVDILLLDIDLGGCNGIDIAKKINIQYPNIKIIFITGYIEFAKRIFETSPTYFLVKPITFDEFKTAVDKAVRSMEQDKVESIMIHTKDSVICVRVKSIKYFESIKRVVSLNEIDVKREIYMKLGDLEEKLPDNFVRCHQSYIVNMDMARNLNKNHFLLYSGEQIPISQLKYSATKRIFMEYLGDGL